MKFFRIIAVAATAAFITASAAFAAPAPDTPDRRDGGGRTGQELRIMNEDPIKVLQGKKEKIQSLLKNGKITKEKADAANARIDARIKEIEEFNRLGVDQKRAKLTDSFKAALDRKVKEGRLTREKADKLLKSFKEKVKAWDGKGYPQFLKKGFKWHGGFKRNAE